MIFLSALSLHAQEKKSAQAEEKPHSRIYLGPEVAHLHLQIWETNHLAVPGAQQNVKVNGVLGGGVLAYEFKSFRALYAGVFGTALTGSVSGDGVPSTNVTDIEGEVRIGYNYQALQGRKWMVSPYFGFSFNYISQKPDFSPSFRYFTYVIPVGFVLDWSPKDWISIEFHFQWRPQVDSTVRVGSIPGARFVLHKKNAQFLVEMPFLFHLGKKRNWEIGITPFWERKKSGTSRRTIGCIALGLPKQSYTYAGGSLTAAYRF